MKKYLIFTIYLAFAMFCTAQVPCWDGTVAESYAGGNGTMENPYQIATPQQLALLAAQTNDGTGGNAYYILTEDLCMDDSINWTPIGYFNSNSDNMGFEGVFDGAGHTISNLYCDNSQNVKSIGLFGFAKNAVIKNVIISNAYLISPSNLNTKAGTIIACANHTDVLNCSVDGIIHANGTIGGIIGRCLGVTDTTYVVNCINNTVLDNSETTGGIIGVCKSWDRIGSVTYNGVVVVDNCINYSDITSNETGGIIAQTFGDIKIKKCENYGIMQSPQNSGGIVGQTGMDNEVHSDVFIQDCINHERANISGPAAGGIVGRSGMAIINGCVNKALITGCITGDTLWAIAVAGGITGVGGVVSNCYNRGDITAVKEEVYDIDYYVYLGGITGADETLSESHIANVYNTGSIIAPDMSGMNYNNIIELDYGNIIGYTSHPTYYYNCYWLDDNDLPACGHPDYPNLPASCSFVQGSSSTSWVLNEEQYGTIDLLNALNAGSLGQCTWLEDVIGNNDGYPIIDLDNVCDYQLVGSEWYYEIINPNDEISYQHIVYENDSTINNKKVKVIVKTYTLYDKCSNTPTHEYIYEENNKVYWWNKTLGEFTVLYDFGANVGDEWTITAGNNSVTVHVNDVGYYIKDARWFKVLTISDSNDVFTGTIACGIGHLTSFFPEKLLNKQSDINVDGIRCYWNNDVLIYKDNDTDCDAIYNGWHSIDETLAGNGINLYPNPSKGILYIESNYINSEYIVINIMGEIVTSGKIVSDNQQIDISNLSNGLYLLKIDNNTTRIIVNK